MEGHRLLSALCVLMIISSALTVPVADTDLDSQFQVWKKKHDKSYSGPEEETMRRSLWEESLKMVEEHNKEADQGLHTYWIGMNQFSDRTKEERSRGCILPMPTDLDTDAAAGNNTVADVGTTSSTVAVDENDKQ